METNGKETAHADPAVIALQALGWVLEDEDRAARLLSLTGLDPRSLRGGLEDPAMLAAILQFLSAHEPDLLACSEATGRKPEDFVAASRALSPESFDSA